MDNSNDKLFGILSYLGILWLVGLLAGKTPFTKFHANQGFILWLISMIASIASVVFMFIPGFGKILGLVINIVNVGVFVLMILGIVNVVNGKTEELPIVGKVHILDK